MYHDLTKGAVTRTMLCFAGPMIAGNLLQQFYNIADTLIVGQALGPDALAAVGSAYTLMTFLTSIFIGLCMGSGAVFSFCFGRKDFDKLREAMQAAFFLTGGAALLLTLLVSLLRRPILLLLQIPPELLTMMEEYVRIIFLGIPFIFLYNYFAYLLRSAGDSVTPLVFLGISSVLNILLDLFFVLVLCWGIQGAAFATALSQAISGGGLGLRVWLWRPELRIPFRKVLFHARSIQEILHYSVASSLQQSVMNFGILMIQGLVNSFGPAVMAAFAAAVKIDTFAYMPAQEFGNAYSLFTSQNCGAGRMERVRLGTRRAIQLSFGFCLLVSAIVFALAEKLMLLFVHSSEADIIAIGAGYLRVEGAFYVGIGVLFLLYGYFRGTGRPMVSLLLTVISLGTRVLLAYALAPVPEIGVWGIWWAIPIGWLLADITGLLLMRRRQPSRDSL